MEQPIPTQHGPRLYTEDEFRRICDTTDQRLDYWEGEIVDRAGNPIQFDIAGDVLDMAGAQPPHGRLAANLIGELHARLKGGPCEVFDGSIQVRHGRRRRHAHPDVTVCCDALQMDPDSPAGPAILNPTLVFEVLSPSTEQYDRNRKADACREIDSLQEYVFVWQDQLRVETYYRSADGIWSIGGAITDPAGTVRLRSVNLDLPTAEVYARVTLP